MAKKRRKSSRTKEKSGTNWILIGTIVVIGAVGLFALLFILFSETILDKHRVQATI